MNILDQQHNRFFFHSSYPIPERAMSGLTISEKILSRASGIPVLAGDIAICTPDLAMGTDASIPMALDYLGGMRARSAAPKFPQRLVFALDHYGESSGAKAQSLQERVRAFALAHEITLYDAAQGIGHQLILESRAAQPGMLIVGADSHSTSYGAVNAFATGIGSSDLAGIFLCGALWLKVPQSIRVVLHGALRSDVSAKDIALWLTRQYGADGASYKALEFFGQ